MLLNDDLLLGNRPLDDLEPKLVNVMVEGTNAGGSSRSLFQIDARHGNVAEELLLLIVRYLRHHIYDRKILPAHKVLPQ